MPTGYTRQSSADIQTGNTIQAAPLNDEFNQLEDFADASTGHNHDGTAGGGAKIPPAGLNSFVTTTAGFPAASGSNTFAARSIAGTTNEITVANGDGVSGNPTAALATTLAFSGKTVTNGTFDSPIVNSATINSLSAPLVAADGGTGVDNGTATITVADNFATAGAFPVTMTATAATAVTLPTTGTLATLAGAETLTNKTINSASNTITVTAANVSDLATATVAFSNKTINSLSNTITIATANISDIATAAVTFSNKVINASSNTITNIGASEVSSDLITGLTTASPATADSIIISDADDSNNLKSATLTDVLNLAPQGISLATPVSITAVTQIDFTSIPSGTKRITVMISNADFSADSAINIVLGDSGGIENTGYNGYAYNAQDLGVTLSSAFFAYFEGGVPTGPINVVAVLTLQDASTNTWLYSSAATSGRNSGTAYWCVGSKALSAELDRLRVTSDTAFAAQGIINIAYE